MKKAEDRVYELHGMNPPRKESAWFKIPRGLSMALDFLWSYAMATLFFALVLQKPWLGAGVYIPAFLCATAWNVVIYWGRYRKKK